MLTPDGRVDCKLPLKVVHADISHAFRLAPKVRQADRDEILAASGSLPLRALVEGIKSSREAYTVLFHGEPCFIFGVVDLGATGAVWALGSDEVALFKRTFLRESRAWLEKLGEGFEYVGNLIDARNTVHIRWLEWLGFTFCEEHFRNGYKFLRFSKCVTPQLCSPQVRA